MYKNMVLDIFTYKDIYNENNSLFFSINKLFTKKSPWRWPNA